MDSSFKHQYSLYESMNTGQYGSSTSLNNLASKSSSRLGSPAVKHSSLGQDSQRGTGSSRRDSAISQPSSALGWGSSNPLGPSAASRTPSGTQFAAGGEPFASTGSFATPLSNGYAGMGSAFASGPYNTNGPMLAGATYGGSGGFGGGTPQYGSAQYPSQYGAGQYGGQFASPLGSQYPHGQYSTPYVSGAYGGIYGNLGGAPTSGTAESSPAIGSDLKPGERNATDELGSAKSDSTNTDFSADATTSAKNTLATGPLASLKGDEDVVQPADIFWHYIDLQGQQQGPFSGSQMNDWMAYMLDTTMVRRVEDQVFVPLASLKEVANTLEPFAVLVSSKDWDQLMSKATKLNQPREEVQAEAATGQGAADAPLTPKQQNDQAAEFTKPLLADSEVYTNASPPSLRSRESSLAPGDVTPSLAALKVTDAEKKPVHETATLGASKPQDGGNSADLDRVGSPKAPVAEPSRVPSAVWKKTTVPAAQISISELKKQQEIEKKQQKKKLSEAVSSGTSSRKSSSSRWLPLEQLETATPSSPSPVASPATPAPSTPTWNKQEVVQTKSLADIKKEQAMKGKNTTNSTASVVAKPVGGTRSNAKPLSQVDKGSRFHALQESDVTAAPAAASPNPPKSRQQRATQGHQPASITSTANMARPTDELVHWARVAFKDLINGVDGMELLDVFLSLPMNNSAKEFIAESVFSYSKTLDGRRFASDFLRRRKTAEEAMLPGETWKDVMRRFNPNVVEQDPSFKVVTKKRAQKIQRPDSMRA